MCDRPVGYDTSRSGATWSPGWWANAYYRAVRTARRRRRETILFASGTRPGMTGNLLRVHDRMIERDLDDHYRFTYAFRGTAGRYATIGLLARADIVLTDDNAALLGRLRLAPDTIDDVFGRHRDPAPLASDDADADAADADADATDRVVDRLVLADAARTQEGVQGR